MPRWKPLNDKHLSQINGSLRKIHDAIQNLPKAQAIGMDITEIERVLQEEKTFLEAAKREFFEGER